MKKQYLYIGGLVALLIIGLMLVFVLNSNGEEEGNDADSTPTITVVFRTPVTEPSPGEFTQPSQTAVITATESSGEGQGETPTTPVVDPVGSIVPETSIPITSIPVTPGIIPSPDTPEWVQWCRNCVEQNCPDTSNCNACPPECVSYYLNSLPDHSLPTVSIPVPTIVPTVPIIPTEIPGVPSDPIPEPPVGPPVPNPSIPGVFP